MENQRYLLDTNTASYIIEGEPAVTREYLRIKHVQKRICMATMDDKPLFGEVRRLQGSKYS